MTFVLDDQPPQIAKLAPGHKATGATFDHFGLWNQQSAGAAMTVYFDDLRYDGKTQDFRTDPLWEGMGNRTAFKERRFRGAQDYGYCETSCAGGRKGEMGGIIWSANPASVEEGYYADRVGPLTLDQPLYASGKIGLTRGYNRPGPHLRPDGKSREWTLTYDPAGNKGNGSIRATLDGESATLDLAPGVKAQGITLDRFGLFTWRPDGNSNDVFFDDLTYTAAAPK